MYVPLTNDFSYLLIREWLNGSLFPLSFMLSLIMLIFMGNRWRLMGRGWTRTEGVVTACTLFWIFMLDACRAGLVWLTYRIANDGGTMPEWLASATSALFVAVGTALILAMIRAIYMFTPARLGHSYWILSVCITLAFLIISHLAPPFPT